MKVKIKSFPIFASSVLVYFFGLGYFLFGSPDNLIFLSAQAKPRVLGAQIDIRGQLPLTPLTVLAKLESSELAGVKAKSYRVFDLDTGEVLAEKRPYEPLPIASLTKLMTAYVVYESLDLGAMADVWPKKSWLVPPYLNFTPGDSIKIQDLFNAMLVGSANDAGFALANYYNSQTGGNFVERMNEQVKILNMTGTSYSNPVGFDSDGNFSTANDLQILISRVFNIPAFKNLSRKTEYAFVSQSGKSYSVSATNQLIKKYPDLFAVKTGYTPGSLGSMATVLNSGGRETAIIILDSPQREADTLIVRQALITLPNTAN